MQKNVSMSYVFFNLNCKYYFSLFYKKDVNFKLIFKFTNILANNLKIYMNLLKKLFLSKKTYKKTL